MKNRGIENVCHPVGSEHMVVIMRAGLSVEKPKHRSYSQKSHKPLLWVSL